MRSVLCFGDSNTWGSIPGSDFGRYGLDVRWPRVMARMLGDEFDVIEAGLGGRTTAFDWPPRAWRSGRDLITPTLETHSPLDVVIILLGTNDVAMPHLPVSDIARGAVDLITIVGSSSPAPIASWRPNFAVTSSTCQASFSRAASTHGTGTRLGTSARPKPL